LRNNVTDNDALLIRELIKDGRTSLSKLARITGLAYTTIREKLERLRKKGLLEIKPLVNSRLIGNIAACIKIKAERMGNIIETLSKCNRVLSVMTVHNGVIAIIVGSSKTELTAIIENIVSKVEGLKEFEIEYGSLPKNVFIPLKNPDIGCNDCVLGELYKCNGCLPVLGAKSKR